jgi:DNA-binding winged helix-turn-helix (wHTH) protein/predicted ATPase
MPDILYRFGPFRMEIGERRLLRKDEIVPLPGKLFETLRILVENHNHLVRRSDLMQAVWPDSIVEGCNIDHNVSGLRKALGQLHGRVTYIETVPRQGYRFIAPVQVSRTSPPTTLTPEIPAVSCLVEREQHLLQLRVAFESAASGARQVVLISGESGIGKTTLVRAFADQIAGIHSAHIVRGDCQNLYGEGEPYMPFLEALGRLVRDDDGLYQDVLEKYAPSWLAQLPSLTRAQAPQSLRRAGLGVTAERMLREMADAIEFLTTERTLVLILEDLHWADHSTIDLVARIAQRTEPARLLVLTTYRPSEAKARSHPVYAIAQQLKLRTCCREIPLGYLTVDGFEKYLQARFGGVLSGAVAHRLHARTQGNPLFLTTVINSWIANRTLRNIDSVWSLSVDVEDLSFRVPDDLRQLIEQQVMELEADHQELIEAASAAGFRFCPAAICEALDRPAAEVESCAAAMARDGRFFAAAGAEEWPDGTVCESYQFRHSVYRDAVYERIPPGRRVRLHHQIGCRLEQGHRGNEDEIAAELAMHFREARDATRALRYLQRAAEQSLIRSAHHEAIGHLRSALGMLRRLPELSERARCERDLLALLAPALVITRGFADPEAERAFRRAYELSKQIDGSSVHFPVVFGLAVMLEVRGQYPKAQQLMERHLPEQERCGPYLLEARDLLACSRFHQGFFQDAFEQGEEGAKAYSPDRHSVISAALGEDPGIDCHTWAALSLWFLGYPDRALAQGRLAVSLARDPSRVYSLANAQAQLAILHQFRQEESATLEWAIQTMALAGQQGYTYRRAVGQVLRGWALARLGRLEEGTRALQEGMAGCAAAGAELDRPYHLALLAEAHLLAGRPAEAAAVLDLGLARASATPKFFYLAELYRLRGVAAMQSREEPEVAERWIVLALETAVTQAARSLELRAASTLAGLCTRFRRGDHGRQRLAGVYARFTEGFDTPDLLQAAKQMRSFPSRQDPNEAAITASSG